MRKNQGEALSVILIALGAAVIGTLFGPDLIGTNQQTPPGGTNIITGIGDALSGMPGVLGLIGTALGAVGTIFNRKKAKTNEAAKVEAENIIKAQVAGLDKALAQGTSQTATKEALYSFINSQIAENCSDPNAARALIAATKVAIRS